MAGGLACNYIIMQPCPPAQAVSRAFEPWQPHCAHQGSPEKACSFRQCFKSIPSHKVQPCRAAALCGRADVLDRREHMWG
jgi:hypothetical protein